MKTKFIFIPIFIFICTISNAQTKELEIENLAERFARNEFSAETYKTFADKWDEIIKDFSGYPKLPYDKESGMIKYEEIHQTKHVKKINYNRILEWAAINFGNLNYILHYKDFESGKIILKGTFDVTHKKEYKNFWGNTKEGINTTKCLQTYIFTVKDNVIKSEIIDIRFEFKKYGYSVTSYYIPDRTIIVSIHDIYPITNLEISEWKEKLDLLQNTNLRIELFKLNLKSYINGYFEDYNF